MFARSAGTPRALPLTIVGGSLVSAFLFPVFPMGRGPTDIPTEVKTALPLLMGMCAYVEQVLEVYLIGEICLS